MPKRKKPLSKKVDALLTDILADAHSENEQLLALRDRIAGGLDLPMDIHVVDEPLSLVALDYDGNARRGLTALCRREDGNEHQISFADVQLAPGNAAYLLLAAYRTWLGIDPAGTKPALAPQSKKQQHKASEDDIDLSRPVELAVLAVKQQSARCRLIGCGRAITLRTRGLHNVVPGQIVTVEPNKQWRHAGHPYLSGKITAAKVQVTALGLVPLTLSEFGEWDPAREYWGEEDDPIEDWAKPIIARGPRPMFEMEQVLPGSDPEDFDWNPIRRAIDLKTAGDIAGAQDLLTKMLEADLRCLDAHVHLGNILYRHSPDCALRHYEVGVGIGGLSLGDDFDGVLVWGLIDNRPFLRCLQGYGLCLWRLKRWDEAERVFERMLWLNPSDNQGIRYVVPDVRAREPWRDDDEDYDD